MSGPVTCLTIVTISGHSGQKSRVPSKSFPRQSTEHFSFADQKIICFIHRGISIRHSCEERSKLIKSRCLDGPGPRHVSAFTKPFQWMQPQQSIKILNVLCLLFIYITNKVLVSIFQLIFLFEYHTITSVQLSIHCALHSAISLALLACILSFPGSYFCPFPFVLILDISFFHP